jgi:NADP-dependent 3-hydroxy acid dehydrogenase YdfG
MLNNKIIVITGAGTGLGKSIAKKVAQLGARTLLIGRTKSELEECKKEIEKAGGAANCYVCDIRKLGEVKKTVSSILTDFKTIDILVNNAGIWTDEELEKDNPVLRKIALETNALGNIQFTYEVLPYFQKKNAGYIFNVISTAGASDTPAGNNAPWKTYGASKWAMTGFTKALRESLQGTKIKVTAFHPAGFESMLYEKAKRSNAHKQPWMMQTEDVADVVVFALTRPDDVMMEKIIISKV